MSDDDKKPARKPLTLKGAQPGEVKQTFSHGRTNKVAVEVKRRRKLVKPGETPPAAPPPPPPPPPAPEPAPAPVAKKAAPKKPAAPADETPQ
ncbi:translation initiation factor IF-2 associated domain-containing protein, partial [Erythrobacter sp. HI0028]